MAVLVPVPLIAPGLMTQVPVAGKSLNNTLPVDTVQVGCIAGPEVGAAQPLAGNTSVTVSVFEIR